MIRHDYGCTIPEPTTWVGRDGDPMLRCPECTRVGLAEAGTATPPPPRRSFPEIPEPDGRSRWGDTWPTHRARGRRRAARRRKAAGGAR